MAQEKMRSALFLPPFLVLNPVPHSAFAYCGGQTKVSSTTGAEELFHKRMQQGRKMLRKRAREE
eukprot:scaffold3178_cov243-Chaetoceros_neogracile.AAC.3